MTRFKTRENRVTKYFDSSKFILEVYVSELIQLKKI